MSQAMDQATIVQTPEPQAPIDDTALIEHLFDPDEIKQIKRNLHLPDSFSIGTLRDARLKMLRPLKVRIIKESGCIVAQAEEVDELGYGSNASEALIDLQKAIVELYFTLKKEKSNLGPDLLRIWGVLEKKILER